MTTTTTTPANRTRRTPHGELLELVALTRVGAAGWEWTMRRTDLASGDVSTRTRRTNRAGRGLWEDDRQLSGTGQYSLPAARAAAIRALLRAR